MSLESRGESGPVPTSGALRTDFPGGSIQSRLVCLALTATAKPVIWLWSQYPNLPWPYRAVDKIGFLLRVPKGLTTTPAPLPNCHAQVTAPSDAVNDRFVVYLHGGAFHIGHRHLHRQLIGKLATRLGTPMLAVDYRMLPEHGIAEAIDDSVAGYQHALNQGIPPEKIVLMGDSAGGYLVLMAAIEARNRGLPTPGAVVAMSPLTNWDSTLKRAAIAAKPCALFPRVMLDAFANLVRKDGAAPPSPVDCDLRGLPPILIQAGDAEMLYSDAVLMASRLADHGVPCELQIWPGQPHVFQGGAGILPEGASAINEIGEFIDRTLTSPRLRSA